METELVTVYDTRSNPAEEVQLNIGTLRVSLVWSAYRFWVSERRPAAAVLMSNQVARAFTGKVGTLLPGGLLFYGYFEPDEATAIAVYGREAYIDPLFQLI